MRCRAGETTLQKRVGVETLGDEKRRGRRVVVSTSDVLYVLEKTAKSTTVSRCQLKKRGRGIRIEKGEGSDPEIVEVRIELGRVMEGGEFWADC